MAARRGVEQCRKIRALYCAIKISAGVDFHTFASLSVSGTEITMTRKARAKSYPPILMNAEAAAEYLGVPADLIPLLPIKGIALEAEPLYHRYRLDGISGRDIRSAQVKFAAGLRERKGWRRRYIPAEVSHAVYARDGRVCAYCQTTEGPFHLDHKLPVSLGGTNDIANLTVACNECNLSKGAKPLDAWIAGDKYRTKRGPGRS